MKLAIISHTPHYLRDGTVTGWGPTVREIDYLATLFDSVVHVAPLHDGPAPGSASAYVSDRVEVVGVPASGGERMLDKVSIVGRWPQYFAAILRACQDADVVHVRSPANISLLAVLMLPFMCRHRARWIKYAGNWRPTSDDPLTYRFQRWWLRRRIHGAQVSINGEWAGEPSHIHSFLNPCLTNVEISEGSETARRKILESPIRLIYVGGIEAAKGAGRALEILGELRRRNLDVCLDLVGDGPDLPNLRARATELGVEDRATFHGWIPRAEIPPLYGRSHVILLPSDSEGWPKVLSEAMAYGVVPLASDVGSISQVLRQCGSGTALPKGNIPGFADEVESYAQNTQRWQQEKENGLRAAGLFGYDYYLERVRALLDLRLESSIPASASVEPAPSVRD